MSPSFHSKKIIRNVILLEIYRVATYKKLRPLFFGCNKGTGGKQEVQQDAEQGKK